MADQRMSRQDETSRLRNIGALTGYSVISDNGAIGVVHEFLFDDEVWAIRYIAVNADDWLPGRKLLVSPLVLNVPDWEEAKLSVALTKEEVKGTPFLGLDDSVSRRNQIDLYLYYGWTPYWIEEELYDVPPHPAEARSRQSPEQEREADPHLFSTREMVEYRIEALNGDVGHVEDFIMDQDDWSILYFVVALDDPNPEVETNKSVLIAAEWVQKVVRSEERVYVQLDKERVMGGPEYDPAVPLNREYELELYDHYGRPRYWEEGDMDEDDMRNLS